METADLFRSLLARTAVGLLTTRAPFGAIAGMVTRKAFFGASVGAEKIRTISQQSCHAVLKSRHERRVNQPSGMQQQQVSKANVLLFMMAIQLRY